VTAPVSCALAEQLVPREKWAAVAVPDTAVIRAAATYSDHVAEVDAEEQLRPDECERCRKPLTAAALMLHAAADAIAAAELRNGLDNDLEPRRRPLAAGDEAWLLDELIDSTRQRITELGGQA
jgi:hypothetical protein